jgi:hypothetical protein
MDAISSPQHAVVKRDLIEPSAERTASGTSGKKDRPLPALGRNFRPDPVAPMWCHMSVVTRDCRLS